MVSDLSTMLGWRAGTKGSSGSVWYTRTPHTYHRLFRLRGVFLSPELYDANVGSKTCFAPDVGERAKWAEKVVEEGVGDAERELLDETGEGRRGREGGRRRAGRKG